MKKQKISTAVVRRLPKYYRHLGDLERQGYDKISSQQLSEKTGFTASQIRQDLNHFGGFGQQGYGYKVTDLKNSIIEIIGLNGEFNAIIVGYGHIGKAIYNYSGFETKKFNVVGVFDINAAEKSDSDVKVRPMEEIEDFLDKNEVDIVVISVPKDVAQDVVDMVEGKGIKGIWNFAPKNLKVKENIPVENIQLSESLYTLIYYMGNTDQFHG